MTARELVAKWLADNLFLTTGDDERTWGQLDERARNEWRRCADAVIAVLPGESRAEIQAQALDDAAEAMRDLLECSGDTRWLARLRDRAADLRARGAA
ncbi:hypothetical protein [Georgenia faecalis]|uniref:hypothetical protein n=1 Tax=Georgenia faecalis TaxID=2483799 RepID=UPI000FDAB62A|nr:hypothetical protein [Georgenia faecalis]